ncbi:MAG: hypothetical protein ACYTHJ_21055 [Planctomycetota bacterium]|jgi:hypothetical protein
MAKIGAALSAYCYRHELSLGVPEFNIVGLVIVWLVIDDRSPFGPRAYACGSDRSRYDWIENALDALWKRIAQDVRRDLGSLVRAGVFAA